MSPSFLELGILWLAGLCFGLAFVVGWRSMRVVPAVDGIAGDVPQPRAGSMPGTRAVFAIGMILALALGAWRAVTEGGTSGGMVLFSNFFDSFLLLGLLLAALGIYFHLTQHLRWLAFFLLPMIGIVMLLGGLLSLLYQKPFDCRSALNVVHVITVLAGSACFAAGCVGGCVYLLADRQLRSKHRWIRFPALASTEKFTQHAGFLGFPLLTIAMITGSLHAYQAHASFDSPKVILAVAAWLVYAVLLHIPLAPSFRGRRAAWLSIIGFVLLLSVFFAVR